MKQISPDLDRPKCFGSCGRPYRADEAWIQQKWLNVGTGQSHWRWMCPVCARRTGSSEESA